MKSYTPLGALIGKDARQMYKRGYKKGKKILAEGERKAEVVARRRRALQKEAATKSRKAYREAYIKAREVKAREKARLRVTRKKRWIKAFAYAGRPRPKPRRKRRKVNRKKR